MAWVGDRWGTLARRDPGKVAGSVMPSTSQKPRSSSRQVEDPLQSSLVHTEKLRIELQREGNSGCSDTLPW